MHNNNQKIPVEKKIKKILAQQIGTDPDEIEDTDSFADDLHMRASDISDFFEHLDNAGFEVSNLNYFEVETVGDLLELLNSDEQI